jgi:hypothetical protein
LFRNKEKIKTKILVFVDDVMLWTNNVKELNKPVKYVK